VRLIKYFLVTILIILVCFGCVSTKTNKNDFRKIDYDESEIIIFTEEILNEFINDEEEAFEKYNNKRFQVCAFLSEVGAPAESTRSRLGGEIIVVPSLISLQEKVNDDDIRFIFNFDYNVKKDHDFLSNIDGYYHDDFEIRTKGVFNKNDKLIIQGTLIDYRKRKYYLIINHFFKLEHSKIIGIVDEEGEVHEVPN